MAGPDGDRIFGTRPRPTPRDRLSRDAVLGAALALADSQGLEALTVRRLAGELEVTPMALYWHVRNKDELLDGVVDRILAQVDLEADDADAPWHERIAALLRSFVTAMRSHPCAPALLSTRNARGEHGLAATEKALDILRSAGFTAEQATDLVRHIIQGAVALAGGEPGMAPALTAADRERLQRREQSFLEGLPRDRFPRLVEAAVPLSRCDDPDRYYARGVRFLLAGVMAATPNRS